MSAKPPRRRKKGGMVLVDSTPPTYHETLDMVPSPLHIVHSAPPTSRTPLHHQNKRPLQCRRSNRPVAPQSAGLPQKFVDPCSPNISVSSHIASEQDHHYTPNNTCVTSRDLSQQRHPYSPNSCISSHVTPKEHLTNASTDISLTNWFFQIFPGEVIVLCGIREGDSVDKLWRSGPITKIISSTTLLTKSGRTYHLLGALNRSEMIQSEIDGSCLSVESSVASNFDRGFPNNWAEIVVKICSNCQNNKTKKHNVVTPSPHNMNTSCMNTSSQSRHSSISYMDAVEMTPRLPDLSQKYSTPPYSVLEPYSPNTCFSFHINSQQQQHPYSPNIYVSSRVSSKQDHPYTPNNTCVSSRDVTYTPNNTIISSHVNSKQDHPYTPNNTCVSSRDISQQHHPYSPNSYVSSRVTPKQRLTNTSTDINLTNWFFQIFPGEVIVVCGIREGDAVDKLWRSGPIAERISLTILITLSGRVYHLLGALNRSEMIQSEIDSSCLSVESSIASNFDRGFPNNWAEIVASICSGESKKKGKKITASSTTTPRSRKSKKRRSTVIPYELRKKNKVASKKSRPSREEGVPCEEQSIDELEGTSIPSSSSLGDSVTWSQQRDQMETNQAQLNSCLDSAITNSQKTGSQGEVLKKTTIVKQVKELTTPFQPDLFKPRTSKRKKKRKFLDTTESMVKEYSIPKKKRKKRKKIVKIADDTSDDDDVITPKKKKMNISTDQSDEEGDGDECDEAHDGTITSSGNNWRVKLGAPISRTPTLSSHLLSPNPVLGGGRSSSNHHGYRDKEIANKVVHQLSNSRKAPVKKKVSGKINAKKTTSLDSTKVRSIRTGELMTWHVIEDSDDDSPLSEDDLYSKLKNYAAKKYS